MEHDIFPGRGIGRLRIGMAASQATALLGKPTQKTRVKTAAPDGKTSRPTAWDEWRWAEGKSDDDGLTILLKKNRIVQCAATGRAFGTPDGLSTGSKLADIRRRRPRLTLRLFGFGTDEEPGYLGYWFVDLAAGIAFTHGTQDDLSSYDQLPSLHPQSLVVFAPAAGIVPVEFGFLGKRERESTEIGGRIRAWLSGGSHRPLLR